MLRVLIPKILFAKRIEAKAKTRKKTLKKLVKTRVRTRPNRCVCVTSFTHAFRIHDQEQLNKFFLQYCCTVKSLEISPYIVILGEYAVLADEPYRDSLSHYNKSPEGSYKARKGRSRKRARLGPQKHEIRVRRQKVFQHLHTVGEILKLVLETLYFLK